MSLSSIDHKEIEHFAKDSMHWWDEEGAFAPLHKLNPTRIGYIRDTILSHYNRDSLKDLSIVDVGCGGGLVCEPLSRLGADVTGVDADSQAIQVAKAHASDVGLVIDYQNCAAEDLDKKFDVVLSLEIIEHVSDVEGFVKSCASLCKDGGIVIFSTLNRNIKSFLMGVGAAEYILKWVPKGTHDWRKFIKPAELSKFCRSNGLQVEALSGLVYDPISGSFHMNDKDIDVNYFLVARK